MTQEMAHKSINFTVITEADGEGVVEHQFNVQPFSEDSGDSILITCDAVNGENGKILIQETDDEFNGLPLKQELQIPLAALDSVKDAMDDIVEYLKSQSD